MDRRRRRLLPASATIGGADAQLQSLFLTPGLVGVAQANVKAPALDPGDYPVVITINGLASGRATVSVGAPAQ